MNAHENNGGDHRAMLEIAAPLFNDATDLMSALGQKQTLGHLQAMSALPPKADITAPT
jgi:hypothetical protein